ncbi:hypothetical protein FO524_12520 [Bacillus mycoides]|uniref:hypothetical protein n=1 Tax=Bacillus mycoides TaxID=1405 RepID=UPI0001A16AE7|nr:hypothetical protein [Bacillus mycoides]EEM00135.1 hypothetical protein bmyco0001_13590 [Bacillus mycoides DSM 2048]MDR4238069.1 hypothetical protein [Bacillus mycoides]MED1429171.1 hypothetical protein [Bacillus mycoides]
MEKRESLYYDKSIYKYHTEKLKLKKGVIKMKKCRKYAAELFEYSYFFYVCGEKHGKSKKVFLSI